ncbi:response regulator [Thalassotalea fusca]
MSSILLVEDDIRLSSLIGKFLQGNNFDVTAIHDGKDVIDYVKKASPDLIILDVMLPNVDGFSLCKQLRKFYQQPILFLTAKDSDFDHVLGLEIGADDFVIKPVEPHVLLARVNVLLRRTQKYSNKNIDEITLGSLHIDKKSRLVTLDEQKVDLTSHEFELLWLLAKNAGEPQSRDYIHQQMIGREYDGLDRSVDVRISRLRKKLGDDTANPFKLITVWGKGYLCSTTAWN